MGGEVGPPPGRKGGGEKDKAAAVLELQRGEAFWSASKSRRRDDGTPAGLSALVDPLAPIRHRFRGEDEEGVAEIGRCVFRMNKSEKRKGIENNDNENEKKHENEGSVGDFGSEKVLASS